MMPNADMLTKAERRVIWLEKQIRRFKAYDAERKEYVKMLIKKHNDFVDEINEVLHKKRIPEIDAFIRNINSYKIHD